jgi:hypothetical protein
VWVKAASRAAGQLSKSEGCWDRTTIKEERMLLVLGGAFWLRLKLRFDEVHRVGRHPRTEARHAARQQQLQRMEVISVG